MDVPLAMNGGPNTPFGTDTGIEETAEAIGRVARHYAARTLAERTLHA